MVVRAPARVGRAAVAMAAVVVAGAGCSSGPGWRPIADPFASHPLPGVNIASDRVDCDGANQCSRYIVLASTTESTSVLLRQVRSYLVDLVSWRPVPSSGSARNRRGFGQGYDGPGGVNSNASGGWIATDASQLAYWRRTHFATDSKPPDRPAVATLAAMAAHPTGVLVSVTGSQCGTDEQCLTGD